MTETTTTHPTHGFFGIGGAIDTPNLDEALVQSGLNFTVSQQKNIVIGKDVQFGIDHDDMGRPVFTFDEDTPYNGLLFPNQQPIVRDDNLQVIANMGDGYRIMQNRDCIGILEDILSDEPDIELVRGGQIKNCERLFICARLPEPLEIEEDRIEKYILIMWSHTGKAAITIRFLPTLVTPHKSTFLHSDHEISIRHTKNGPKRLAEAGRVLYAARKYFEGVNEVYKRLLYTPFDDEAMDEYLNVLFPDPEAETTETGRKVPNRNAAKRETILEIWSRETAGKLKGTRWDALKSVCNYTENANVKVSKKLAFTEPEVRLDNVWHGSGQKLKKKAQATLLGA